MSTFTYSDTASPVVENVRMPASNPVELSGEQIAVAAYALPPLKLRGFSLGTVLLSIILAGVTLLVAFLRIWVRLGLSNGLIRVWKLEDYLFVIALVSFGIYITCSPSFSGQTTLLTVCKTFFIPSIVWSVIAALYGVGLRDADLPSPLYGVRAGEYIIYWELLYFVSSTLIKSAIGFTCIRIDQRRRVTYPVLLNITIMCLVAILAITFVFANCRPLAATWNPAL